MYCWESLDPKRNVWVAYPDDLQAVIEAALLRKDAVLKIKIGDVCFTIQLSRMVQSNLRGSTRRLRRLDVIPPPVVAASPAFASTTVTVVCTSQNLPFDAHPTPTRGFAAGVRSVPGTERTTELKPASACSGITDAPVFGISPTWPSGASRVDIAVPRHRAFLVHNLFSPEECDTIVAKTTPHLVGMEKLFPATYRQADRALLRSPELADAIFQRLLLHFQRDDIVNKMPMCFGQDGVWVPHSCNDCVKVSRYQKGGYFVDHRDGPWIPCESFASIYTVVLYLNDDFSGGHTHFVTHQELKSEIKKPATVTRTTMAVPPKKGALLVFEHDILHNGQEVTAGTKYILRTEVIFRRTHTVLVTKDYAYLREAEYLEMRRLYDASQKSSHDGNAEAFVEQYQRVVSLQLAARERNEMQRDRGGASSVAVMNDDTRCAMLSYLADKDVALLMICNRRMYYDVSQCTTWEDRATAAFPAEAHIRSHQHRVTDWYTLYTKLRRLEKKKKKEDVVVLMPLISGSVVYLQRNAYKRQVKANCVGPKYYTQGIHCNVPDRERFTFCQSLESADRERFTFCQNEVVTIPCVTKSFTVNWYVLLNALSPDSIKDTVLVIAHPSWDEKECDRCRLHVLESPSVRAVAIVHPALCAAYYHLASSAAFLASDVSPPLTVNVTDGTSWWVCKVSPDGTTLLSQTEVTEVEVAPTDIVARMQGDTWCFQGKTDPVSRGHFY